jgi:hypothetical protein
MLACVTCLSNSYSPTQSSAKEECVCNAGYSGPGGSSALAYVSPQLYTDLTSSCGVNGDQMCSCISSDTILSGSRSCSKAIDADTSDNSLFTVKASVCIAANMCSFGQSTVRPFIRVDFTQPVSVTSVKIKIRWDGWAPRNFNIFIGDSTTIDTNTLCVSGTSYADTGQHVERTFECIGTGRYIYIQQGLHDGNYFQMADMQVVGSIPGKNNPCLVCVAGTFKPTNGSAACTNCAADTYSTATGRTSSFEPCQVNAVSASGSASQDYCYCKIGYAHAVGMSTCRICDPGTYNSQLGRTACSNCSVGMYSVNYGAIGSETCLSCPLGQWSPEGSPNCNFGPANSRAPAGSGSITKCLCDAGYTGADGSTCVPCEVGTYKDTSGSGACSACPANAVSVSGSASVDACSCIAGHFLFLSPQETRSCLPCAAGSYKNGVGNDNCTSCWTGSSVSVGESSEQACCPAHSTVNTVCEAGTCSSSCLCNSGYTGPLDIPCETCAVGKYKNTTGTEPCGTCAAGSFSDVNASMVCMPCPENTFSEALGATECSACPNLTRSAAGGSSISACQCGPGYTGAGGLQPCTPCAAGTYKIVAGSGACTACPARTFSGALGSTSVAACRSCHPNATSAVGSPSEEYCYCEAGFAQVNGTDWWSQCFQ